MTLVTALTFVYLACYQACSIPAIVRMVRRKSSEDLSIWRELLTLLGLVVQTAVIVLVKAPWQVWISPVLSIVAGVVIVAVIVRYRRRA